MNCQRNFYTFFFWLQILITPFSFIWTFAESKQIFTISYLTFLMINTVFSAFYVYWPKANKLYPNIIRFLTLASSIILTVSFGIALGYYIKARINDELIDHDDDSGLKYLGKFILEVTLGMMIIPVFTFSTLIAINIKRVRISKQINKIINSPDFEAEAEVKIYYLL
mmetsp:Transcript_18250/g.16138  ORF Transcript_18250/g.16138 Transcript_18250/m.16138 type:complete len:167 (-) Transcript_18250:206-706(-)